MTSLAPREFVEEEAIVPEAGDLIVQATIGELT
jgi:hypothetical protein